MPFVDAHGARIPAVGLGTWELRGRICSRIVEQALRLGYRHIDTAQIYDNEADVGEGVRKSGVRRQDIFITTKIGRSNLAPRDLIRTAKESLGRLHVNEVDLLLIHWPSATVPLADTLGALAQLRQAGLVRHIGVSNFTVALMEEAISLSSEPLVCNQVECHPYIDQSRIVGACRDHGMALVAYSPIARGSISDDAVLNAIGERHGRTAAQICLRWLIQQHLVVIPRTSRLERLGENLEIFDFDLSDADMSAVAALRPSTTGFIDPSFTPKRN